MNEKVYSKLESKVEKLKTKHDKKTKQGTEKAYFIIWKEILKLMTYKNVYKKNDLFSLEIILSLKTKGLTTYLKTIDINKNKIICLFPIDVSLLEKYFIEDNLSFNNHTYLTGEKEIIIKCSIENILNIVEIQNKKQKKLVINNK